MKHYQPHVTGLLLGIPALVTAQTFGSLVGSLVDLINTLVVILMALSLLVFFWGTAVYIFKMGDTTGAHQKGYEFMFWGVVIFFVMASVWGIVNLLASSIF